MIRHCIEMRPDWRERVAQCGIGYSIANTSARWDESACYEITQAEADEIFEVTSDLYHAMIEATDVLLSDQRLMTFGFSPELIQPLVQSWEDGDYLPTLFSRFDFEWQAGKPLKLVGMNLDTPALLLESAWAQWDWICERTPWASQYNTIEERLAGIWREYHLRERSVHLGFALGDIDQFLIAEYLQSFALEAGVNAKLIPYNQIHFDRQQEIFTDRYGEKIDLLINLGKPMTIGDEDIARAFACESICIAEPLWKSLWQNPAWLPFLKDYCKGYPLEKAITCESQQSTAVRLASWVVAGQACGIGIIENARFIPHLLIN